MSFDFWDFLYTRKHSTVLTKSESSCNADVRFGVEAMTLLKSFSVASTLWIKEVTDKDGTKIFVRRSTPRRIQPVYSPHRCLMEEPFVLTGIRHFF